jgi:hypothetical protein
MYRCQCVVRSDVSEKRGLPASGPRLLYGMVAGPVAGSAPARRRGNGQLYGGYMAPERLTGEIPRRSARVLESYGGVTAPETVPGQKCRAGADATGPGAASCSADGGVLPSPASEWWYHGAGNLSRPLRVAARWPSASLDRTPSPHRRGWLSGKGRTGQDIPRRRRIPRGKIWAALTYCRGTAGRLNGRDGGQDRSGMRDSHFTAESLHARKQNRQWLSPKRNPPVTISPH